MDKISILKRTREEKGISLDMVHEGTKIPMDVLRALEEGYKVGTLSPFYYKGFLKIYAQFLDVDFDKALADYQAGDSAVKISKEESKIHTPPVKKPTKIKQPLPTKNLTNNVKNILTPQVRRFIFKAVGIIFVVWMVVKIVTLTFGFISAQINKAKQAKPKPSRAVVQETANPRPVSTKVQKENLAADHVSLTVRSTKESWLRVKVDGRVVFQSTLKKGMVESWNADDEIEIVGRNLSLLEYEVNGQLIGMLGRADRKAKKVIINKKGLSIKK